MIKSKAVCEICGAPLPAASKTGKNLCLSCLIAEKEAEDAPLREFSVPDFSGYSLPARAAYPTLAEWCVAFAITTDASDIHFKAGLQPYLRKGGILFPIGTEQMTDSEIFAFYKQKVGVAADADACSKNYDFSFSVGDSRFRGNLYHDNGGWSLALRHLHMLNLSFRELGIPEILKDFVRRPSGLILVTGSTGSGKTTTLTCLIDYINHRYQRHIITLEDPIEYLHTMDKCIISQREIGRDIVSYEDAIVQSLREDPDILLVGEMRDRASVEAALRAAETGHLVLSTLHTRGSASTINRIIDIFPVEQQSQIRTQLAMCLIGTVSQQLIPTSVFGGRCLATEVMRVTYPIQAMIRENKVHTMENTLQTGAAEGMYTMRKSLHDLFDAGKITAETLHTYDQD